jgi:hypothetical protein
MLWNAPRVALALLTLLGSASAGRLSDFAKRGGYGAHVEGSLLQKRNDIYPTGKNKFRFLNQETER